MWPSRDARPMVVSHTAKHWHVDEPFPRGVVLACSGGECQKKSERSALWGLQAGAVAGVVVLQHGLGIAPGVAGERGVAHGQPPLPPARHGLPRRHLILGAAPLAQLAACTCKGVDRGLKTLQCAILQCAQKLLMCKTTMGQCFSSAIPTRHLDSLQSNSASQGLADCCNKKAIYTQHMH